MTDYTKLVEALRYCVNAENCKGCKHRTNNNSVKCRIQYVLDAADAIEELQKTIQDMTTRIEPSPIIGKAFDRAIEVKDKDYLIQQQADEIERLRRDVKKQQEKMLELAEARELKEMEEIKTWVHQRGALIIDYDIYEMLTHNYGRKPKRGKWIDTVTAGIEETVCSVCRCSGFHHFKYCPGCGAEMEVLT